LRQKLFLQFHVHILIWQMVVLKMEKAQDDHFNLRA